MIYRVIEACLEATAEKSIGPTYTSRNLFLISSILYNNHTYFDRNFTPFDGYRKSLFILPRSHMAHIYTYAAEVGLTEMMIPNFNNSSVITNFLASSDLFQNARYIQFKSNPQLKSFLQFIHFSILHYLSSRSTDGSATANTQLSSLPNGDRAIDPNAAIDFSTYAEPLKWTPLVSSSATKYLTPQWGSVRGFVDEATMEEYHGFVDRFLNQVDFEREVRNTFDVSLRLGDKEMCVAEFWAGGKNTITPPGFWNLFLCAYFRKYHSGDYTKQAHHFITLNSALFQTSIAVWGVKLAHLQARPIQTIRYYFGNETFDYYFGKDVSGALWKPYQPDDFMSPPFPDFISGHSTFSSVGAAIMKRLVGNSLIQLDLTIPKHFTPYMSPLFANPLNREDGGLALHCFTIFPQTSTVNTPVAYPTKAVQMVYHTWDDMAIEAGVSRIYGGIHYECSNYAGYLLGSKIAHDPAFDF